MNPSPAELQALHAIWLPVALYALVCSASPGPVNFVAVSSGMRFGLRRTLPQITGATLGFSLLLLAIGMGLGELLRAAPWLLVALKAGGSLFLCHLAYKLFRAAGDGGDITLKKPPTFWDGALAQWLNPKAWLASSAGVATYTVPGAAYRNSVFGMTLLFLLMCFISFSAWAMLGASAKNLLGSATLIRRLNMGMALLLLLSVFSLFL
ncbi:LysE family translocator [Janthinobacterium fluminis]|uniref:LysE family translocator n=1 Tax=Janthinobacterium fluminis TaxID=2987524 RepID=A0ABT5K4Q5_9BURK|nr:LysE family translocator [Janthinobacterium fluminis]MDC8759445.1 LysE family translocator [Janthinobacterium fluminis]